MDWVQSTTRIAWNLEMTKMMLIFLRENVSTWEINFIHHKSNFYVIICGYLLSSTKEVSGRDLISIPLNLNIEDEVNLTITNFMKLKIINKVF